MQTIGGAEAEAAIMSRTRSFRARVRVDWNNDGLYTHALSDMSRFVEDATTDRALKGSLPSDIMLVEGSAAAQLSLTVGGEYNGLSLTSVFSPYNGLSPLYTKDVIGAEVIYDIGLDTVLGTVWYPQFVGNISEVTPERLDNRVDIRCLDRVEKLRAPVLTPQWALSDYWANRGRKLGQLFDTQNVIQMCLQQSDTSASGRRPSTRAEYASYFGTGEGYKMLFVSGANGHVPTTGWWDNGQAVPIANVEGSGTANYTKNGPVHPLSPEPTNYPYAWTAYGANTDNIYQKYWMTDRFETSINSEFYIGGVLNINPAFPNGSWHVTAADTVILNYRLGEKRRVDIMVGTGQMWLRFVNENNGFSNVTPKLNIPTGVNNVEFFAHVDATQGSGTRAYMRVGNNAHSGWQYISNGYPGDSNYDALTGLLQINRNMSMSDVCVSVNFAPDVKPAQEEGPLWKVPKYAAVLDPGLNRFSFVPDGLTGKDAWDVITSVAGAEFGSVFWDEGGAFHFWNYNTIKNKQNTVVRTLDVDQIADLKITNSLDSVRNALSVSLKKRQAASYTNVYKSNSVEQFYVPSGTIAYFDVQVDNVQFMEPRFLQRFTKHTSGAAATAFMSWNEYVTHGYVYQQLFGDGWREPNDSSTLDVSAWYTRDGIMRVRIVNFQVNPIRLAVSDQPTVGNANSTPACWIGGTAINDQATLGLTTRDNASIGKYGQRNYEASGDWYQEYYNANGLASVLLSRTVKPIPTTDQITIAGDPRLQLGDTIQLNDSDGLGEQLRAQITGINRKFAKDKGLTDVLTVELLRPAGLGIWNSSQYGRWDQSLIWN